MTGDDALFDRLPGLLFGGLRERMLLGITPSRTVGEILGPLLSRYDEAGDRLSSDLRRDVEDILRLYPEVAEGYGLSPSPRVGSLLSELREMLLGGFGDLSPAMVWEGQARFSEDERDRFKDILGRIPGESGEFIRTDRGREVRLELRPDEDGSCLRFECSERADLYLCGRFVAAVGPEGICVPMDRIAGILEESDDVLIELREKT
ncbi:MAG: hypothetical protein ACLGPL_11955 [Acidobacteriota bacterium]